MDRTVSWLCSKCLASLVDFLMSSLTLYSMPSALSISSESRSRLTEADTSDFGNASKTAFQLLTNLHNRNPVDFRTDTSSLANCIAASSNSTDLNRSSI